MILQTQSKNQYSRTRRPDQNPNIKLLIESDTEDFEREEDYVNQLEDDDISSFSQTTNDEDEKEGPTVNVLTRDQNILLHIIQDIS